MISGWTKLSALVISGLLIPGVALAEGLSGNDAPTLRCVISQCDQAEDCRQPFNLGGTSFNTAAGSDFMFPISSVWDVTPGHFKLDNRKYLGDTYLSRTLVKIDIDRATKALKLVVSFGGSGVTARDVTASGSCEAVNSAAIFF